MWHYTKVHSFPFLYHFKNSWTFPVTGMNSSQEKGNRRHPFLMQWPPRSPKACYLSDHLPQMSFGPSNGQVHEHLLNAQFCLCENAKFLTSTEDTSSPKLWSSGSRPWLHVRITWAEDLVCWVLIISVTIK